MDKFKTSAIEILKREKKPLHYKDITRLALETGILETEGATPEKSMNSQIIMDIKNKKEASDFIKTAPSIYALNPNKKEPRQNQKIAVAKKEAAKARAGPEGETSFPYGVNKNSCLFTCPVASRRLCYGARPSENYQKSVSRFSRKKVRILSKRYRQSGFFKRLEAASLRSAANLYSFFGENEMHLSIRAKEIFS